MHEESTGRREKPIPVKFYLEKVEKLDPHTGEKVFQDREMVECYIDSSSNPATFRVEDKHRYKWAKQYRAFKAEEEQIGDGHPLKEWPLITPSQLDALQMVGLATVEELAAASASKVKFLGGNLLQQKAKTWLEERDKTAGSSALLERVEATELERDAAKAELDEVKKAQMAQNAELEQLKGLVEALTAKQGDNTSGKQEKRKAASGGNKSTSGKAA